MRWGRGVGERGRGGFGRATDRNGVGACGALGCGLGAGGLWPRRLGLLAWRLARGVAASTLVGCGLGRRGL